MNYKKTITSTTLVFVVALLNIAIAQDESKNISAPKTFAINTYVVEGNNLINTKKIISALEVFTGKSRTMSDIDNAVQTIKDLYVLEGYPVVQIFTPEQEITKGTVILRVIEGKISKITVSGNKIFSEKNILNSLPIIKINNSPNANEVANALSFVNENSVKQTTLDLGQGAGFADIDAKIAVNENNPLTHKISYDNSGSLSSGYDRITMSMTNANFSGKDDNFNIQLSMPRKSLIDGISLSGSYRQPFYNSRTALELSSTLSKSNSLTSSTVGDLFFTGSGVYFGAKLIQSLNQIGAYRHKLTYGIDYKDFANDCSIQKINLDNCGSVTSVPLSINYQNSYRINNWQLFSSISYLQNIIFGPNSSTEKYSAARSSATRNWNAMRINANAKYTFNNLWNVNVSTNSQYSSKNLIPSEQFGIGGSNSVRGYDERTIAGDSGWIVNLELGTPNFARSIGLENWQMYAVVFSDWGEVRRNLESDSTNCSENSLNFCKRTKISSVGVGLRMNYGSEVSLKLDLASPQVSIPDTNNDGEVDKSSIGRLFGNSANGTGRKSGKTNAHFSFSYSF